MIEQIVDAIIGDLEGRKGIGDDWELIDLDIQQEIRDEWIRLAELYF